jgi:hypothetical protein
MAILHRIMKLEAVGLHSRQRVPLPFSADRFKSMGADRLPAVAKDSDLPAEGVYIEVSSTEASSSVPAGYYKLPAEFARRDLEEIVAWLTGC